jgi:hypothetical protein
LELVVEDLVVVDELAFKEAVELFGVDAVGTFHFPVEAGGVRLDVAVADAFIEHVDDLLHPHPPGWRADSSWAGESGPLAPPRPARNSGASRHRSTGG